MPLFLLTVAAFLIVGTLLPLLSHDHWVVRLFDFPRVQLAIGMAATLVGIGVLGPASVFGYATMGLLGACMVYQIDQILSYTPLAPPQVQGATGTGTPTDRLSILVANVEIENRKAGPLLRLIDQVEPDLALVIETDDWWAEQLAPLHNDFPHSVTHPRENAYGMCLFSRYDLVAPTVRFLVEDDVPSIHTRIALPSGTHAWFHGVHPRPPHPTHEPDTTERDAELILLAREIQDREALTVVGGDLNDVSWSYTTQLFQNLSGLLDPRIGRGFYSTFHARYPLLRYPLDHAFHSEHFRLSELEVLPYVGSDHFPVHVELEYHPEAEYHHDEPDADRHDEAQAVHELDKLAQKRAAE